MILGEYLRDEILEENQPEGVPRGRGGSVFPA